MAQIQPVLRAELDPARPVPEVCAVISAVLAFHRGQERAVLQGVKEAVEDYLKQMEKGDGLNGRTVSKNSRYTENQ